MFSTYTTRNVINQFQLTVRHFSANGISLRLGEAKIKIYKRSWQTLLYHRPSRRHRSHLLRSCAARFARPNGELARRLRNYLLW